jgi:hypothetical protein
VGAHARYAVTMSDIDYSLLEEIINLGGQVVRSVDLQTGEVERALDAESEVSAPGRALLSTAHKRPFILWTAGASLLKVTKGENFEQEGGGLRGKVKGFSRASRRRLMQTIAQVKRDAELPVFITLTYPFDFPTPKESKRHLKMFLQRFQRAHAGAGVIWKLEPQERGAPHYHMLAWGPKKNDLWDFVPCAWHDIAGGGDKNHLAFHFGLLGNEHCVSEVRSFRGVWAYASKYLGKTFEVSGWENKYTGRFWAVVNRENIPFGQSCAYAIPLAQAVHIMRYQKRFAKLKRRKYPSLTTFCDADQWIQNVMREEV